MSNPTVSSATGRVFIDDRDPTTSETPIMDFGNFWLNTLTRRLFQCHDETVGALIWELYTITSGLQTFAPRIIGSTSDGTGTYTTQVGRHEKIGNQVFIAINLVWTAHTGSGNMLITDLPFVPLVGTTFSATVSVQNITLPLFAINNLVKTSGGNLALVSSITSAIEAPIPMSNSGTVVVTMSYMV